MSYPTKPQIAQRNFAATIRSLVMIRSRHLYPLLKEWEVAKIVDISDELELEVRARYIAYQKTYNSLKLAHESKTAAELEREAFHGDPE